MRKIAYTILSLVAGSLLLGSCTMNYEEYNTNQYALRTQDPSVVVPAMFDPLMYVQQNNSQMTDQMVGSLGGYFTIPTRFGGQNFDTFNVSDDWNDDVYNIAFTAIFSNFFTVEESTGGEGHWYALAQVLKAGGMMRVADCYGPIPYSQVRKGEMYVPYDTAEEVYSNIISDLLSAAPILANYASSMGTGPIGSSDPVYNGDYSKWAKFAVSLAMRAAMRSGDSEAFVQAYNSACGYISTNADNAMMDPRTQSNPYYLSSASWGDLRISANIVDYMEGYNDPRMPFYFTTATAQGVTYEGLRNGQDPSFEKSSSTSYSMINFNASSLLPVFVAAESHFLIAEAILKGWIEGDAQSEYEQGIALSFEQWGAGSATDYIANTTAVPSGHVDQILAGQDCTRDTEVKIAWSTASTTQAHLEQVITQKWIANFPMGLEAWADYRRTGYPELYEMVQTNATGATIHSIKNYYRLRYPFEERNLNGTNYSAAVTALGGDTEDTPLFWTKR